MSGFLKSVAKVFKSIVKSPIFKAVAIAAAIYFTGGLALTAIGGEAAAFASALPGISSAAEALGIGAVVDAAGAATGTAAWVSGEALVDAGIGGELIGAAEAAGEVAGGFTGPEGLIDAAANPDYFSMGATSGQTAIDAAPTDALANTAESVSGGINTGEVSGAPNVGLQTSSPVTGAPDSTYGMLDRGLGVSGGGTLSPQELASLGAHDPTTMQSIKAWYGKLDPLEKKILGEGISQLGKGALSQLSQKSQQEYADAVRNQQRADVARKGQVPNITSAFSYTKGPGLINSVTQGPIKVGG